MSEIRVSNILSNSPTSGVVLSGITTSTSTGGAKFPTGNNGDRITPESGSIRYNKTAKLFEFYNGTEWKFILPAEQSTNPIGLFAGGYIPSKYIFVNNIQYVEINSLGNSKYFGQLDGGGAESTSSCSSSTRSLIGSQAFQRPSSGTFLDIGYVTISTKGNPTNFGNSFVQRYYSGSCSSSTRGIWSGGQTFTPSAVTNTIDYVTIATTGNALNFGILTSSRRIINACSSPTRGVFGGGRTSTGTPQVEVNTIDFITIASTGNATSFGQLFRTNAPITSFSSNTRGIWAGGYTIIEYATIASAGNTLLFGKLTDARYHLKGSVSSNIRGIVAGGTTYLPYESVNSMEYITISTLGDSVYFGNLYEPSGAAAGSGGSSNSHGGLT